MRANNLKLGTLVLDGNLVLAPMAGYTDVALRVLCRRAGASLVCSEMVHASAVLHENPKTKALMAVQEAERPVCIQLFGSDPAQVAASLLDIEKAHGGKGNDKGVAVDAYSFNFGCPAVQIKASGCGAALLDEPERVGAIVAALRAATKKPLIPKMRLGNKDVADYVDIAQRIEAAGADALIVHGRTAAQGYSGKADWDAIRDVVEAVKIPVIANGDVVDGPSAKACLKASGAAGLAIGRAALGDPDIFRRISAYLKDGTVIAKPTSEEKLAMFKEYIALARDAGIDRVQIVQQAMQFTKGMKGGARLREKLSTVKNVDDLLILLDTCTTAQ
jgi:tRNA-dihydrouridine synthase B